MYVLLRLATVSLCALLVPVPAALAQASQSRPAAKATSRPAKPVKIAEASGDKEALSLAKKVVAYAGGSKGWKKVKNLVFTFGGRRRLFWDRVAGKLRVEIVTAPGRRPGRGGPRGISVYDFKTGKAKSLTGAASRFQSLAETCRRSWINDTYWLLVNLKVMDAGVKLAVIPAEEGDAAGVRRLRLRFGDGIGVTPKINTCCTSRRRREKSCAGIFTRRRVSEPG